MTFSEDSMKWGDPIDDWSEFPQRLLETNPYCAKVFNPMLTFP